MITPLCRTQLNDNNNAFKFFDKKTAKVDCNVAQASQSCEILSGVQLDATTTRKLGRDLTGPTGLYLAQNVFEAQGYMPVRDYLLLRKQPVQMVRDLLSTGWYVVLFVDYGVLNTLAPDITGDKNYTGYHAIGIGDWWRGKLGRSVHYYDPLNDGRHAKTPKGVQVVKFSHVRDAAIAYSVDAEHGETGTVVGYAVNPPQG